MKVVIVGGVATGASCAARISRLNKDIEIVILEKSSHVSYANCGLPYYIGGVIKDERDLTVQTKESLKQKFNIDARTNSEVIKIDRENKEVVVKNLLTEEVYHESYDKLVISTGADPIIPNIKGIYNDRIFTLKNVSDAEKMHKYISENNPKSAVVIGGGFIGLETMENLSALGIETTLIEATDQVLPQLDKDFANILHKEIIRNGVNLVLNDKVVEIKEENTLYVYTTNNVYETDFVVLAVGVTPNSKIAKECGLKLGVKDSILVDEHLLTSDSNIYAGGDVISVYNPITNRNELISLAGPANKQGRIIANNICDKETIYKGSVPISIIKLYGYTAASVGINEKTAKQLELNYETVITIPNTNASYYPGFSRLYIKVIYEKETTKILGGQIIGKKSVDKTVDTLSAIIFKDGNAQDLMDIDLAYSPVYSSAKNPLNMIGYIIDNIESGLIKQWQVKSDLNGIYVDIRDEESYKKSHIDGAINIPFIKLRENIHLLDKSKNIYLNCYSGLTSYLASRMLIQEGFNCFNLKGGYNFFTISR